MTASRLEFVETDEAGNDVATYICSPTDSKAVGRLDVVLPQTRKSPVQQVLDVFLPAGYPHSVTEDYLEYQVYDSLQAFSSSIAGLLSSRAVLSSVGVGDSTASPTAALLLSILQESAGRVATILFAHRFGTSLEPECKMYRLLADILNDFAFVLDCLSPAFPKPVRVLILSFSSVLRALCGVAAGSAKASLSAHFARWGNLGELNAKDSSQETVISLMGMLVGSLVVSWVTTPLATWTTLILLLSIHLETNRRAVRAVTMRTLNRQRATLVYHHLKHGHVPTPKEVSKQERIFEWDGVLRDTNDIIVGYCTVGATVKTLLSTFAFESSQHQAKKGDIEYLSRLVHETHDRAYLLSASEDLRSRRYYIVLKRSAGSLDVLKAWYQALYLAESGQSKPLDTYRMSISAADELIHTHEAGLRSAGWDLDTAALETSSSRRVRIVA